MSTDLPSATGDLYARVLSSVLFPAFEAARGRPTVQLLDELRQTQWWSTAALRELQQRSLVRLIGHAATHTDYYRDLLERERLTATDFHDRAALAALPVLDRHTARATLEERTAVKPRWVVQKSSSGTTGEPVVVRYDAESRHWRDATKWRGYGWAGYRVGMRALHYWGTIPPPASPLHRWKIALDRRLKRDYYVDCIPRGDQALQLVVDELRALRPHVIVAYASAAAALARYVIDRRLRAWPAIPVVCGAERLWPHERAAIVEAFGPAFETYGCRELMMVGAECRHHDGLHVSMETMIVEIVVRRVDGSVRAAKPGELGEVAITDLHNLASPMIRYLTGDLAIAREQTPCPCGRGLERIGPIEGRTTDALRDHRGNPVSGLAFSILFAVLEPVVRAFQVVQRSDGRVVIKVVPLSGSGSAARTLEEIHQFARRYLAGLPVAIEQVSEIPLTAAGKRKLVLVEPPAIPMPEGTLDSG
ncbi:MAG: phenylacetate--CoA ligase family protein [Kofleriaceae bacterium]